MLEALIYYIILNFFILLSLIFLTLWLMRRDKHYAISLIFLEISFYVALSSFGQGNIFKIIASVLEIDTELSLSRDTPPDYNAAATIIVSCGLMALVMMALRTWDKRIPRDPSA